MATLSYIPSSSGNLEAARQASPLLRFETALGAVELKTNSEFPIKISARDCDVIVDEASISDEALALAGFFQFGELPPGLYPSRQYIEKRGRSFNAIQPETGRTFSFQGFGLGYEHAGKLTYGLPRTDLTLDQYDNKYRTGIKAGVLCISPNGEAIPVPAKSPAGGITHRNLHEKVAKTRKAEGLLKGYAVVPTWIATGTYPELANADGGFGWGVYTLPANIASFHLAEISQYWKEHNRPNSSFLEYLFKDFKALRRLHEQGEIHAEPHGGNRFATIDNNGQIFPIYTDFSKMYNVHGHQNIYGGRKAEQTPALQTAMVLDFTLALTSSLNAQINFAMRRRYFDLSYSTGLSLPKNITAGEYEDAVKSVIVAACLGYVLPGGFLPKSFDFASQIKGIGNALMSNPPMQSALRKEDFRAIAYSTAQTFVLGMNPAGAKDNWSFDMCETIRNHEANARQRIFPF